MKLILSLTTLVIFSLSYAQVEIDTLKIVAEPSVAGNAEKLHFPIIKSGNKEIDSLITYGIARDLTYSEPSDLKLETMLSEWADESLVYLDFIVTMNQKGILSFYIDAEGCGAYCTGWTNYYNYSTVTGAPILIEDVLDLEGDLGILLLEEMEEQINAQEEEFKELAKDPEWELDEESVEWTLEYYDECRGDLSLESFLLYPDAISIYKSCYFPHIMQAFEPYIALKHEYTSLSEFVILYELLPEEE